MALTYPEAVVVGRAPFLGSVRDRRVSTSDQRRAWLIVLATIPVGWPRTRRGAG